MIKLLYYTLILALSGLPGAVNAADQTCQEEGIPAYTPTSRFSDHGDGTVTDTQTDLMWAKCAEGLSGGACLGGSAIKRNWEGALDLANISTLADYDNWRLPNIKELRSIVEQQCYRPAINLDVFPNTPSPSSAKDDPGFWSASPAVWSI
ncbi:MAG: DUF1566 domain-containing protein, partial [Desulfobacterales bacterium]|nr:DUF1566 domain-containing protein [Desulfobacterales bacterium]